jgi:hypothetical protein
MEDKYYKKYLKYKRKYLELKYGGGPLSSLFNIKNLTKGFNIISNIIEDVDIETLIPTEMKEEFNTQLMKYLNSMNDENVKLYLEDAKIIKPLLQDIGDLFLTNINKIMDNIDKIIEMKDKELKKEDIEIIKKNLLDIQKDLVKIKIKKPIKMAIIVPQVALKIPNLTVNIAALKNSNFIKSIPSFKKIIQKLKIPNLIF